MGFLSNLFGGGERDSSGEAAAAEERRKAALRARIDALYGIDSAGMPAGEMPEAVGTLERMGFNDLSGKARAMVPGALPAMSGSPARDALEAEKTKLADATRSYYTDELQRSYEKAARNAKFNLARRGVLGGSGEVDLMSELETDRNLGATRIDEAVRRAIAGLDTSREQERLNAIGLVNSGAGDSAVTAAQRGLQNAFENQSNAQKTNLTSDLFSAGADAATFQNMNDQQLAQMALYRSRTSPFFTPKSTSGRVTPS